MRKFTQADIANISIGDFVAKYPIKGEVSPDDNIDEADIEQTEINVMAVLDITMQGYKLGYSVLGLKETIRAETTQTLQELLNGKWWTDINLEVFTSKY